MKNLSDEKQIFYDSRGKRWLKVLAGLFLLTFFVVGVAALGYIGIFLQKSDLLPKDNGHSNYNVINDITTQRKERISVSGEGTFVKVAKNEITNRYQITREPDKEKKVVLTFDDGPDPKYTREILNILEKENVPGSFFVIGKNVLLYPDLTREIVSRGNEIGNHTFSHHSDQDVDFSIQENLSRLKFEINFTQNAIISITGFKTNLFRSPYWGAENDISENTLSVVTFAKDKGYLVSAPTVDTLDYEEETVSGIVKNSITPISPGVQVLLFHDGGGDRSKTLASLPEVIRFYKTQGYQFTTLSGMANKQVLLEPSAIEKFTSDIAVANYKIFKGFPGYLNPLFFVGLLFTLFYSGLLVFLSFAAALRTKRLKAKLTPDYKPAVAVLVPAYNEEKVIGQTIASVLASDYKKIRLIVVDDGSTDRTLEISKKFEKDDRLIVLSKKNGGKYSALNWGIKIIKEPVFISLDADTQVGPTTISNIVRFFQISNVGAVAGNIKVGNSKNFLGALQSTEYIMNLNLERNAYSLLNSILVVPGALGAWRTRAVRQVGGYTGSTLTEDAELTLKILKAGYKIVYDNDSISYTEAPTNVLQLIKQRFRWTLGVFQTLFGQKDLLFRRKNAFLGFFVLPFTIFIQIPVLFVTPIMDIFALYYFLFVASEIVLVYLGIYLILRVVLAFIALRIGKEKLWYLFLVPLQRFFYQPILYAALYKALLAIIRGRDISWKKLEHFGTVVLKN